MGATLKRRSIILAVGLAWWARWSILHAERHSVAHRDHGEGHTGIVAAGGVEALDVFGPGKLPVGQPLEVLAHDASAEQRVVDDDEAAAARQHERFLIVD